jgi:hypothetical protein
MGVLCGSHVARMMMIQKDSSSLVIIHVLRYKYLYVMDYFKRSFTGC